MSIDKSFYELAIKERDYERVRNTRLEAQLAECKHTVELQKKTFDDEVRLLEAERDRAESDRKRFAEDFALSNAALAECQRERDALYRYLENAVDLAGSGCMPHPDILDDWRDALAATRENDGE